MKRILIALFSVAAIVSCTGRGAVTLTEDAETFTLSNGIIDARVSKVTGDLVSYRYNGVEMFATKLTPDQVIQPVGDTNSANPNWKAPTIKGKAHGYWSHDAMGVPGSEPAVPSVTIDPRKNGGKRGEVSVKGISGGRKMGTGPGTNPAQGDLAVDIDIRYTLEKGASGVYTYCIFNHEAGYPDASFGEARYCAKLNDDFDWMSVDKNVDFHYPKTHNAGDKYVYTAVQSINPAFGWSGTGSNTGLFIINPSMEYMSGGPTKVEFMGHRNTSMEAEPCVLNYWRSSHYGGARASMAAGEKWSKVIGPFFIYCNSAEGHDAIYADAQARAAVEAAKWPYSWVSAPEYAKASERATVSGKLVLDDEAAPATFSNLHIGLVSPDEFWQTDAKNYQFWTVGAEDGSFSIPNVRAGKYTLVAFTDGVLGELTVDGVEVKSGKLDMGDITWKPVRKGKQVFEVGVANRNGSEFAGFDEHRSDRIAIDYAVRYPSDINFEVGKSDCAKDWFYIQVPHCNDPANAKVLPFFGIRDEGRETPFNIIFNMDEAPAAGNATLRIALCGTSSDSIAISVNGTKAGDLVLRRTSDGVITRHGSHGIWYETEFAFDASLLHAGNNTLTLTVPAGSLNTGIVYDYLRLEI